MRKKPYLDFLIDHSGKNERTKWLVWVAVVGLMLTVGFCFQREAAGSDSDIKWADAAPPLTCMFTIHPMNKSPNDSYDTTMAKIFHDKKLRICDHAGKNCQVIDLAKQLRGC